MAASISRTLIRSAVAGRNLVRFRFAELRFLSGQPESSDLSVAEAEARAVRKIEDAIHGIIVKRSKPDWLPFMPGSSYWVPPRRSSYGVEQIVSKLTNALTEEECLSLTTLHGWPSRSFFVGHDEAIHSTEPETSSANSSLPKEEG